MIPAGRSEKNEIHLNIGKMTAVLPDKNTAESLSVASMTCPTGFPFESFGE
jgi:hypothetical protein